MINEMTTQIQLQIIDEIFDYPAHYTGFSLSAKSGIVNHLAWKFQVEVEDVLEVLNQMLADEQLIEIGFIAPNWTYGPNPTMIERV